MSHDLPAAIPQREDFDRIGDTRSAARPRVKQDSLASGQNLRPERRPLDKRHGLAATGGKPLEAPYGTAHQYIALFIPTAAGEIDEVGEWDHGATLHG